jgi:hypothetical protein
VAVGGITPATHGRLLSGWMTGGAGASSCSNGGGGTALSVVVRGAGSILTVCRGPPQTPVPLVMSPDSIHSYVHRDMTAESRTLSRLDSHNSRDQLPTTVGKGYMTKEREGDQQGSLSQLPCPAPASPPPSCGD